MKPRADITFREFKAGCKRNATNGSEVCRTCEQKPICDQIVAMEKAPAYWDLSDPPRFNEAQMALLKALYGLDFVSIKNLGSGAFKTTSKDGKTGMFMEQLGIGENETLDLAELLGKEGAE